MLLFLPEKQNNILNLPVLSLPKWMLNVATSLVFACMESLFVRIGAINYFLSISFFEVLQLIIAFWIFRKVHTYQFCKNSCILNF
jgi:hypothetical protein